MKYKHLGVISIILASFWTVQTTANEGQVIKNIKDPRAYATFTLDNGMQVVTVSDKNSTNAAVALSVGVGSYQDPVTQQGLAHYLEHVIFLGSEEYAERNKLIKFVSTNGGRFQGTTYPRDTTYQFSVTAKKLPELLSYFSASVRAPIFDKNIAEKEVNAVHAEWQGQYQGLGLSYKRSMAKTVNPLHPYSQFGIGNKSSLSDKPDSRLNHELREFYQQYYSANLMKLVVVGSQDLSELKALVRLHFSSIENRNTPQPEVEQPFFTQDNLGKHIAVKSKTYGTELHLQFPLDIDDKAWADRTAEYIERLISSKAQNTLGAKIKDKGWLAVDHRVNVTDNHEYVGGPYLSIIYNLTRAGARHKNDIVAATLDYINTLKQEGINQSYAAELRNSLAVREEQFDIKPPMELANDIARNLHRVSAQDVMRADTYFTHYNPEAIAQALSRVTVDNMRLIEISKGGKTPNKLNYADGEYGIRDFSVSEYKQWANPTLVANLPANQLVEEVTPEQYAFNPAYSTPKTVYESKGVRAMLMHSQYHQDNNGLIRLTLRNKETVANVDNYSNAIVLNDAFRQKNKAFIERMADSYGVIVKLEQDNFGNTTFQLNGRTSQQATILQQLISEFKSFEIDKKQVKSSVWIKTAGVKEKYINKGRIPDQLLQYSFQSTGSAPYLFDFKDRYAGFWRVKPKSVTKIQENLLDASFVDIIAFGNYEPSQLAEVARAIRSELGESTAEHSWRYTSDFKVTQGHHKNANISVKKDGVGIMVNYLYPEKSIAKLSQLQLLNQFFERAFFTELRTNKKLGYVAASFVRSVHDYPAFAMLVESHNTDLVSVEGHIDSFVESFLQSLIDLDEQDFVDAKQAAINNLAKKPESLAIEAKPYLSDWNKGHLGFDTAESQIKALKSTHKDDLIELYRRVFMEEMHAKDTIQIKGKNFKKTGFFCEDCAD